MKRRVAAAFSLVEVTLALGVAGFALLAIFGLLPVGLNASRSSIQQTAAAGILALIDADLHQAPSDATVKANSTVRPVSPIYQIDVTRDTTGTAATMSLDESGAMVAANAASARYTASISLKPPDPGATPTPRTATYGTVTVSWPANAARALGSVGSYVAIDRN